MMAQKWDCKTHEYKPYILPLGAVTFRYDMNDIVTCAGCGKESKYGDFYTSLEIHNSTGIGYAVCEECYNEEWKRKRSDNNA